VVLNTLLSDPEREARVARRSGEVTATNAA